MRISRFIQVAASGAAVFAAIAMPAPAHGFAAAAPIAGPVATEAASVPVATPHPAPRIVATYKISVGLEGEVFPAFANYASLQRPEDRRWGTIGVTITNSTGAPLRNRL